MTTQPNTLNESEKAASWRLLFDGKTLSGWRATGRPEGWAVEDGAIACTVSGGKYLATEETYENYQLALEYKLEPKCNSGVFIRWTELADPVNTGIEIQVFDHYGAEKVDKHTCGAIYDLVPPSRNMCRPAGEWNQLLIVADGPRLAVSLNDAWIAEMNVDLWTEAGRNPDGTPNKFTYAWASRPRRGHIGLQDHGGRIWYRNIKLLAL